MTVYGEEGSLHYNWVVDPGTGPTRIQPYVSRAAFASEEWHDEPVPERILESLPRIANGLHRDWATLAREFVADIRGQPHEPYPTFRQGWIFQEIVEAVRAGSGWETIPQDVSV